MFTIVPALVMSTASLGQSWNAVQADFGRRILGEVPIFAFAAVLVAACIALLASRGVSFAIGDTLGNMRLFALFSFFLLIFDIAWQLNRNRPSSPVEFLKGRYFDPKLIAAVLGGLPMLAVAIMVLPFFSKMKAAIPLFNEFTWDQAFIEWDQAIFFGYDAWEVMQPVLGYPIVTAFLAFLYHLWFLLLYPGVMFFVFAKMDSQLRRQFFLTYMLSWALIGGLMATWLASVGPCFLEPMLGNPHFSAQMAYLYAADEQVPIMVLDVQELLLEWHGKGENGLGSGITAMPSMHVAIAFLFWIAVRRIHSGWGAAFGAFFAITWISSVHLAYHYAVDGLVSVLAVIAIWWASQRIIAAWDAFIEFRAQAALRTNTVPAE